MFNISSILDYGLKAKEYFNSGVPLTVSVTNDTDDLVLHPNGFYATKVEDNVKYDLSLYEKITATTSASFFDPVINPAKISLAAFNTSKFSSASAVCFELEVRNKQSLQSPYTIRVFYNWKKEFSAAASAFAYPSGKAENAFFTEASQKPIYTLGTQSKTYNDGKLEDLPFVVRFIGAGSSLKIVISDNPEYNLA